MPTVWESVLCAEKGALHTTVVALHDSKQWRGRGAGGRRGRDSEADDIRNIRATWTQGKGPSRSLPTFMPLPLYVIMLWWEW